MSERNQRAPRRKESLDEFLSTLSAWDVLYVRGRIRQLPIALAGLEDVPYELRLQILEHLDLADLLACQTVSKRWNKAWSLENRDMARVLCRRFFPGLIEIDGGKTAPKELFTHAARKLTAWQRGMQMTVFLWDSGREAGSLTPIETRPDSTDLTPVRNTSNICYSDGLLAWQPNHFFIMIDDLHSRTRQRVTYGQGPVSGRPLQLEAASRDLVACVIHTQERSRTVYIYHLREKMWREIELPASFVKCYIHGERVAAVTATGMIITWSWGGIATQLEVPESLGLYSPHFGLFGRIPGFIFHPGDPSVAYGVWAIQDPDIGRNRDDIPTARPPSIPIQTRAGDESLIILAVVKYKDNLVVEEFRTVTSDPFKQLNDQFATHPGMDLTISCQKANERGTYMLFFDVPAGLSLESPRAWRSVYFNVVFETFEHHYYREPVMKVDAFDIRELGPGWSYPRPWNGNLFSGRSTSVAAPDIGLSDATIWKMGPTSHQAMAKSIAEIFCRVRDLPGAEEVEPRIFIDDDFAIMATEYCFAVWQPSSDKEGNYQQIQWPFHADMMGWPETPRVIKHYEPKVHMRNRLRLRRDHFLGWVIAEV